MKRCFFCFAAAGLVIGFVLLLILLVKIVSDWSSPWPEIFSLALAGSAYALTFWWITTSRRKDRDR